MQREEAGLVDLAEESRAALAASPWYNEDLAPTRPRERSWGTYHIAALWIGMAVCLPSYSLASGAIALGLSWWQAILVIAPGNLIVLGPMQLNSHAGTRYGIPFPVFCRLSFGVRGAHLPSLARAVIAAGWFGIQCWFGGLAILAIAAAFAPGLAGNRLAIWTCYALFWALNVWIAMGGSRAIKLMEAWGSPLLIALSLALLLWALATGGWSFGPVLASMPPRLHGKELWDAFLPQLTVNIAFWSTLALNIPDFSRYARSQRAQAWGQALGLPTTMAAFAFVGVAATGAAQLRWGELVWNPAVLLTRLGPVSAVLGGIGVIVATLTTNVAANIVAPANGLSNLLPRQVSYRTGALIAGVFGGFVLMPWRLLASAGSYFAWLGVYGAFLGPLAGIFVADYYLVRRCRLELAELFRGEGGRYWYHRGVNVRAILVWFAAGLLPLLGGALPLLGVEVPRLLSTAYAWGWLFGFGVALVLYPLLAASGPRPDRPPAPSL